jgi:Transcription factor Pcc1
MSGRPYQSSLRVSFASNKQASIVQHCLEFDEELQPTRIEKSFEVIDKELIVYVLQIRSLLPS